jgi:hypothetical protein
MLAYSTVFDFLHLPSGLEVVVYLVGLLLIITLPSLLFSLGKHDRPTDEKNKAKSGDQL